MRKPNEKWTSEQSREYFAQQRGGKRARKSKHGNIEVVVDGFKFKSKLQASHYGKVKLMLRGKMITRFEMEVKFSLEGKSIYNNRDLYYQADFVLYYPDGRKVIVDSKARTFETKVFKKKWRRMQKLYPDYEFQMWREYFK